MLTNDHPSATSSPSKQISNPKLLMDDSESIGKQGVVSAKAQKIHCIGAINTGDSFINAFEVFG